jgi:16S rRNA A1518/A1519 N6-dimethyltransferase RsmA/KsgA/DIM1 with predicted DNA glycosylase/AP lyase activity
MVQFDFSNELEEKISNIGFFRSFVRSAFGKRRKMLRNALKDAGIETKKLNSDFDFSRRAESLTPEEFIELSNKFYRKESKTGYD